MGQVLYWNDRNHLKEVPMKKRNSILCFLILMVLTSGCVATPTTSAVASKANNDLEEKIHVTADSSQRVENPSTYSASFTNTTGSLQYTLELTDIPSGLDAYPVLQVTPHTITSEEAETVARAIFGDAEIYEYSGHMTKSEIEEQIQSFQATADDRDAIAEIFGNDEDSINSGIEYYQKLISDLEEAYEDASDETEQTLCDWQFYPDSYYDDEIGDDTDSEEYQDWNKTLYVKATSQLGDDPYKYYATNRSEDDGDVHYYAAFLGLPGSTSDLYSTEEPTQADIEQAKENAQSILDAMDQGEWEIRSSYVLQTTNSDSATVYGIILYATRNYQGIGSIYSGESMNLTDDDVYSFSYGEEYISFDYSGGRLVDFDYECPWDVVSTINDNVAVLSFQEAIDALETWAGNTELPSWAAGAMSEATVNINRLELGLYPVRIRDNDTNYYLLPCYTFYGTCDELSMDGDNSAVAVINAVDGTVVDVRSGY
jgi:hypothetical protein